MVRRPLPQPLPDPRVRDPLFPQLRRPCDFDLRHRAGLPPHPQVDRRLLPRQGHVPDQQPQQLLPLPLAGRGGLPHLREVAGQRQDLLPLRLRQASRRQGRARRGFLLQAHDRRQLGFPLPLQGSSDQAVLRLDRHEPPAGQLRLIPRPFQAALPLLFHLALPRFDLVQRRQRHRQLRRLHGGQQQLRHGGIDGRATKILTGAFAVLDVATVVARALAIALVADGHGAPAATAQHDPLQQGAPFPRRAAMGGARQVAVIFEPGLVALILLPGDIAGVGVLDQDRGLRGGPVRSPPPRRGRAPAAFDPGATVSVGTGIGGVMQDLHRPAQIQRAPDQLALLRSLAPPRREEELVARKIAHHRQGAAQLFEPIQQQPHGSLDGFIRIEHDPRGRIIDEADRQGQPQRPLARLLPQAAQEPLPEPVQLRLAHRPLEPQQQAIIVLARVVDAVFIDHQGLGEGADLQEPIPVAAGAGQAGGFQGEDRPGPAQAHLGHEELEAIPRGGGGARAALILIEQLHPLLRPAQRHRPAHQIILAGGAGGVGAHLRQGRLAHINEGQPLPMVGLDLSRCRGGHANPPWRSPSAGRPPNRRPVEPSPPG